MSKVLEVSGLTKIYGPGCPQCRVMSGPDHGRNACGVCGSVVAVADVEFTLHAGEILGIMGESGSGKSTLARILACEWTPTAGRAVFHDAERAYELFALNAAQQRWLRNHRFGVVQQNPHLGLNFAITAGGNIAERLLTSGVMDYGAIRRRACELLRRLQVPAERIDELPGRFSGGMQQRVQIAKALAPGPALLFLDEVTTGLDVSVQARLLDLILEIQHELGTAMIVVSHDLGVIRLLAQRTLVLQHGRVVEAGLTDQILEDPQHAYTQQLVASAL